MLRTLNGCITFSKLNTISDLTTSFPSLTSHAERKYCHSFQNHYGKQTNHIPQDFPYGEIKIFHFRRDLAWYPLKPKILKPPLSVAYHPPPKKWFPTSLPWSQILRPTLHKLYKLRNSVTQSSLFWKSSLELNPSIKYSVRQVYRPKIILSVSYF